MFSALWNLLFFCIALGILITVHELGHFTAARLCGVKVLRFSLGFGPVLIKYQAKNGCQYALSAIPLGGYVKMEGESLAEGAGAGSATSFKSKGLLARAFIIAAGPFSNILLSVVLYVFVNMSGVAERLSIIGDVVPGSVAQSAGFQVYDKIERIDGKNSQTWQDAALNFIEGFGSDSLNVEVRSNFGNGDVRVLNVPMKGLVLGKNESPLDKLGLKSCIGNATNEIAAVVANSPAQRASLKAGDAIVSIDGQSTPNWYRIQDAIRNSNLKPLALVVKRDGRLYSAVLNPEEHFDKTLDRNVPFAGIGAKILPLAGLTKEVRYNLSEAVVKGFADTWDMSRLVLMSVTKLVSGSISADNISGPIAIAKGAGESAEFGFVIFVSFLAAISVNLGILNLLPIPVLDGGQLLFIAYEAVMRREPSARMQAVLSSAGLAILLSLMFFAIFNDLRSL